ncbi:MAG: hypothetical protein Q7U56_08550, partial [Humidesulfovibrio sp.]|nr:hypothetical protein [Humidesulfovibrio sp.]
RYLESQRRKLLGIRMAPLQAVFRSSHEKREPERVLKTRAPRLGKSRQEADARHGTKHWVKSPDGQDGKPGAKPGAKPGGKPGAKSGGKAGGKPKGKLGAKHGKGSVKGTKR